MGAGRILCVLFFWVLFAVSCRSADKQTQICEQNNTECIQRCNAALSPASKEREPYPLVNQCDIHCEVSYRGCLKRQQNKSIRGVGDY